jgi:hypothetical protein
LPEAGGGGRSCSKIARQCRGSRRKSVRRLRASPKRRLRFACHAWLPCRPVRTRPPSRPARRFTDVRPCPVQIASLPPCFRGGSGMCRLLYTPLRRAVLDVGRARLGTSRLGGYTHRVARPGLPRNRRRRGRLPVVAVSPRCGIGPKLRDRGQYARFVVLPRLPFLSITEHGGR